MERLRYGHVSVILDKAELVYGPEKSRKLIPCERILDPDLRVGILSANNLLAPRFLLTPKDKQSITLLAPDSGTVFRIALPGKSAFLYFGENPDKNTVIDLVQFNMKRDMKRDDHLHLTTVKAIEQAGWEAWWTPLPDRDNWLHVRLVSNRTTIKGELPELTEAKSLCAAFKKAI